MKRITWCLSIFILVFCLAPFNAYADNRPYPVGLLNGLDMNVGELDVINDTTTRATDRNPNTNFVVRRNHGNRIWYKFDLLMDIDRVYTNWFAGSGRLELYDDDKNLLYRNDSLNQVGQTTFTEVIGVRYVSFRNRHATNDMQLREFEVYGNISDNQPIPDTHSYYLSGIDQRPTDQQINNFINQYQYVFPVRLTSHSDVIENIHIIGSNNPIQGFYDEVEDEFVIVGTNLFRLRENGSIENYSSFNRTVYTRISDRQIYTTEIGEPNTAGIYFTYTENGQPTPPEAPTNIRALEITENSILLVWDSTNSTYTIYQDSQEIATGIAEQEYLVTGLEPDTSYTFQVSTTSTETGLTSDLSAPFVVSTVEPQPPAAPQNVQTQPQFQSARITWNAVDTADYYIIYRDGIQIDTTTSTSYTDVELENGTTYSYRIVAANSYGQSEQSAPVYAIPAMISFADTNVGFSPMDMVLGGLAFLSLFNNWIIIALAVIFAPILVWICFWLIGKLKKKKDTKQIMDIRMRNKSLRKSERDRKVKLPKGPVYLRRDPFSRERAERIKKEKLRESREKIIKMRAEGKVIRLYDANRERVQRSKARTINRTDRLGRSRGQSSRRSRRARA